MKTLIYLAASGLALGSLAAPPALVPRPVEMIAKRGTFLFTANTTVSSERATAAEAQYLVQLLNPPSGLLLKALPPVGKGAAQVQVGLDASLGRLGPEAYEIAVSPNFVLLKGATPAGTFNAIQTLRQLLPKEVERREKVAGVSWEIPCVEIRDYPRFAWRGLLLDVSRHFFTKQEVKELLDAMALQKLNVFHWHLVDDQGWRIEIKKYPKLTEVGAWRKDIGFGLDPKSGTAYGPDGRYGGFYSQDDIREVVAYAKARHITVVPEIEMPGHSGAVLAAFPQFGCEGKAMSTDLAAGVHASVYCAGRDETFGFLQDVLTELFPLFPGQYVHVGGDEVPKANWEKCDRCQARIRAEGLKNEHELQGYFIRRIEKFLRANGRTLIGWSEIREGGLARNAALMDWIGGAVEGASEGHDVVMSPTSHCYLDYYQAKSGEPRAIGGLIPLRKVYEFEPVPAKLKPEFHQHIIGAQGNLWTEYIASMKHAGYMAFPRATALAEVAWTPAGLKNYEDFLARLPNVLAHFDAMGVHYRRLTPEPAVAARWKSGETKEAFEARTWDITPEIRGAGSYDVTFQFTGGGHRLDIAWAALLVNGQEVARDRHEGVTGTSARNNTYRLRLDAAVGGAKYELQASIRSDGGTDSNGEIHVSRAD